MAATHHEQSIVSKLPQPQPKRHRRTLQVSIQAANRFHLGLLYNVRRVQSRSKLRIETELDKLLQIRAVPQQELLERMAVACTQLLEKLFILRRMHDNVFHVSLLAANCQTPW